MYARREERERKRATSLQHSFLANCSLASIPPCKLAAAASLPVAGEVLDLLLQLLSLSLSRCLAIDCNSMDHFACLSLPFFLLLSRLPFFLQLLPLESYIIQRLQGI